MPTTDLANAWFSKRGWKPFAFQRRVWAAVERGESGLLHASTGAGKTYAVWLAALRAFKAQAQGRQAAPLQVIWITPMRALAADTARALQAPLDELGLPWSVGVRSGDTSSAERARQARRLPSVLVTTPESLTLLLTRAQAEADFATLRLIVVDEWHELLGNKRGVQLQ
ncbi:DEAD/DEAH box helicase, partial [Pseudomonas sp. NBRC 111127]